MATQLQIRRGTAAQVAAFTGAEGEIVYNSTNDSLHTNDGATAGGFELARIDGSNFISNVQFTSLTASGEITANGGIALGDNDKATFGASDDLQIYHDGSNSRIVDAGTGYLKIQATDRVAIRSADDSTKLADFYTDGAVKLYYANAEKLATTATGIDVTGTATMDGLVVSKAFGDIATLAGTTAASDVQANLLFNPVYDVNARIVSAREGAALASTLSFETGVDNTGNTVKRQHIASNGDISFYEDTGTTPKMVWDASAESLGIGTSAPATTLHVYDTINNYITLEGDGAARYAGLVLKNSVQSWRVQTHGGDAGFKIHNDTTNATALSIATTGAATFSGNVGIGTSSPSAVCDITGTPVATGDARYELIVDENQTASAGRGGGIAFARQGEILGGIKNVLDATASNSEMSFQTRLSGTVATKMVLDASGNLLVGKISTGLSNQGAELSSTGQLKGTAANQVVAYLNRTGSDGTIAEFRKDNATVGSIGAFTSGTSALFFGSLDTALLANSGNDSIHPWNASTNSNRNAAIDLGNSANRFKDLYLSGTATMDGLVVDGGADGSTSYTRFTEYSSGYGFNGAYASYKGSSNELIFGRHNTFDSLTANDIPAMSIARATGDISFYEDTGTTAKLFWDASAESLGIGTSSPNVNLEILSGGTFTGAIRVGDSGSSRRLILEQTDVLTYTIGGTGTSSVTRFVSGGSSGIGTERMRIDASGNLLVGQTAKAQTAVGFSVTQSGIVSTAMASASSADNSYHLYSTGAAAYRFYVGMHGTVFATTTTISAISDVRYKENIRDLDDGLSKIMALQPRKFDWKEGKGRDVKDDRGWIAQEIEVIFPDLVDEWLDESPEGEEPYKSVRPDLIPVIVKAMQEQQAIIEALTARLEALEGA